MNVNANTGVVKEVTTSAGLTQITSPSSQQSWTTEILAK